MWNDMINWEGDLPKVIKNKEFHLEKHAIEEVNVITGNGARVKTRQLNLNCEEHAVALLPSAECSTIGPAILVVKLKPTTQSNTIFYGTPLALLQQPIRWMQTQMLSVEGDYLFFVISFYPFGIWKENIIFFIHYKDQELEVVDCKLNDEECKSILNEYTKGITVNK